MSDQALADELAELDDLPAYITLEETWTFLRCSEATLYRILERGELARRRIGGRTLVPRASIRAWVLRQAETTPEQRSHVVDASAMFRRPVPPTTERTAT